MQRRKIFLLLIISCYTLISGSFANGLQISSVAYNNSAATITFTISWQNSWSVNNGPNNYDAVWVFIKRQGCGTANGLWSHALLSTTSNAHSAAAVSGSTLLTVDAVADGMGVFIRRLTYGNGNINSHTITLQLSGTYNPSVLNPSATDNFKAIGIEMVYVPQSSFYAGDGRPNNTSNFNAGTSNPVLINSTIQSNGLGNASNYCSNSSYGCPNSLPSSFPLGYNGFYCMKYEITQQQIVDFLNTLTYVQQAKKLSAWGSSRLPNATNQYFDNNQYFMSVYTSVAGASNYQPAIFTTGHPYLPEGFISWQDLSSYLDWAGLRPMTEFEFEKACRGSLNPVSLEYPWGNTLITDFVGTYNNQGYLQQFNNAQYDTSQYIYNNEVFEGVCNSYISAGWGWQPFRPGFAATAYTTRSQAAATYYGIMEMGGNMYEQCIGGAGYDYSGFTNVNGNGLLTATGLASVPGWPTDGGANSGTILRGGSGWSGGTNCCGNSSYYSTEVQTSDRTYYAGTTKNISLNASGGKQASVGGRGVRTF